MTFVGSSFALVAKYSRTSWLNTNFNYFFSMFLAYVVHNVKILFFLKVKLI